MRLGGPSLQERPSFPGPTGPDPELALCALLPSLRLVRPSITRLPGPHMSAFTICLTIKALAATHRWPMSAVTLQTCTALENPLQKDSLIVEVNKGKGSPSFRGAEGCLCMKDFVVDGRILVGAIFTWNNIYTYLTICVLAKTNS